MAFLYKHVIDQPCVRIENLARPQSKPRVPVVLTSYEVGQMLGELRDVPH